MMSSRVSGVPPRRPRNEAGAALASLAPTALRTDAAVVLAGAAAVAPKSESQPEPNALLESGAATTSQHDEPTTGITLARGREEAPTLGDPSSWLQPAAELPSQPEASGAELELLSELGVGRRRWLGVGAGALALLGAVTCWMLWGAEPEGLPREGTAPTARAAPAVTAPIERATPAVPSGEPPSARPRADETSSEPAPSLAEPSTPTSSGSSAVDGNANRARAPRLRAPKKVAAPKPVESPSPVRQDETKLRQIVSSVVQKAENCDRWGRATGTAQLFMTFEPSGRVKQARLVGEPIASAAVARCILHHARAASVPAFEGPAFTVSRKITLR